LGYADYTTNRWNDNFDYTYGDDLWKEKLDYTRRWLMAHIEDAQKLGKPLILEEFGKAVSAAKVFSGLVQHAPEEGTCAPFLPPSGCIGPSWFHPLALWEVLTRGGGK
jgi:hypothetical protein